LAGGGSFFTFSARPILPITKSDPERVVISLDLITAGRNYPRAQREDAISGCVTALGFGGAPRVAFHLQTVISLHSSSVRSAGPRAIEKAAANFDFRRETIATLRG